MSKAPEDKPQVFLKNVFNRTVRTSYYIGVAASTCVVADYISEKVENGRALTDNEIEMAQEIFKDSIDYSKIVLSSGTLRAEFSTQGGTMAAKGNLIFADGRYYESDYSKTFNKKNKAAFFHELTHVWQGQNCTSFQLFNSVLFKVKTAFFDDWGHYKYTLKKDADLLDYNHEQQANIVEEYSKYKKEEKSSKKMMLERVLDKFIKDPSYANLACVPGISPR